MTPRIPNTMLDLILPVVVIAVLLVLLITLPGILLGLVVIGERQVGVVIKKFSGKNLAAGKLVALSGEAGYQADTLAPGWHFGYWSWMYSIQKVPVITI